MLAVMLLISILLGLIPLAGIGWIVVSGTITTVDGLFESLEGVCFAIQEIVSTSQIAEEMRLVGPPLNRA